MARTRILGIDPGFDKLGVCVLDKENGKEILVHSSCIVTSRNDTFSARLVAAGNALESLLETYKPEQLAIEKLFFTKNQTTAMMVAEMRGVILYLSQKYGLTVFEYSPPQIKLAVTGYGKATKQDIGTMVGTILKLGTSNILDDEMDAIAIALTHSAHYKISLWK
jgi:crossover junction endodeoxyribonuclease RuvC